jgi:hypothetical protein
MSVHINCSHCKKSFSLRERIYRYRLERTKRNKLFCSPSCAGKSRVLPPRAAECDFCKKGFWIPGNQIANRIVREHVFCSHRCAGAYITRRYKQQEMRTTLTASSAWLARDDDELIHPSITLHYI